MTERLLTTQEVAEYLHVHPKSVDRWASRGEGPPFVRLGSVRRYDKADLDAWLEARKVRH